MFNLFMASAYAQDAAAPAQPNPIMSMVPLVLVFMVFYFLMLRPQKKKMEEERKYIETLGKGEEVYTKSGIIGKIHGLTEKVVTLELEDGHKMKVLKSYIAGSAKDILNPPVKNVAKK